MVEQNTSVEIPWNISYLKIGSGEIPTCLILHGFMQTAERVSQQLSQPLLDKGVTAIALQAPFPVYQQKKDHYKVGYSWYFYDHLSDTHVIEKSVAVDFVKNTLQQLGFLNSIETVVGFSQGAYLSPRVGVALPSVKKVIGLQGRFWAREFEQTPSFELIQVNGEDDQVVDALTSKSEHEKLLNAGGRGEFHLLPGVGHEINDQVRDLVATKL